MRMVLVHGLWHDGSSWDLVRAHLDAAGVPSVAVELPMTSFDADVAAVRDVLDWSGGPVVLAGHSYGGAVITAAGVHRSVRRLVYLAAFQLAEGESISRVRPDLEIPPTRLGEFLRFEADGTVVRLDPAGARELMYHDVPEELSRPALHPVARSLFSSRPEAIAWRRLPSTYAVCTADRTVAPALQRAMADRADDRVEWDCGHTPLLARPQSVADLLRSSAG